MADGVDAAVDHVEASGDQEMVDRANAETHREQLPARDDSVLPRSERGESSDPLPMLVEFAPIIVVKSTSNGHRPRMAAKDARVARKTPKRARGSSPSLLKPFARRRRLTPAARLGPLLSPNLQAVESATEERPASSQLISEAPPTPRARSKPLALLVAMRPGEWIKNILVFAGLVFAKKFDQPAQVADVIFTFIAFCAVASAGYLFNDLSDIEHDRRHPDKRFRPIAAGEIQPSVAWATAALLAVIGIDFALIGVSLEVAALVALYGLATVAYSLGLKRLVIIDVMTIASLFILRVVAGAVAVEAHASPYLLVCTAMLALFLGFTKRRQEAILEARALPAGSSRRASSSGDPGEAGIPPGPAGPSSITRPVLEHYSVPFLDQMVSMVTAAAIISYILYAINSPHIGSKMLATAPSVLYGIFRYLYLIYDREDTRPTATILIEDPGMIFAGVTWVASALVMLYAVG